MPPPAMTPPRTHAYAANAVRLLAICFILDSLFDAYAGPLTPITSTGILLLLLPPAFSGPPFVRTLVGLALAVTLLAISFRAIRTPRLLRPVVFFQLLDLLLLAVGGYFLGVLVRAALVLLVARAAFSTPQPSPPTIESPQPTRDAPERHGSREGGV